MTPVFNNPGASRDVAFVGGGGLPGNVRVAAGDFPGRTDNALTISAKQRTPILLFCVAAVVAALAPYPATKLILGVTFALYWAGLLVRFDERFLGLYVLLLPTLQLLPLESAGIPGLNWQTLFLFIFVFAAAKAPAPATASVITNWLAYFCVALVFSALHSSLGGGKPLWPLLAAAKNWAFPFALFFLARRLSVTRQQLWFLVLCVSVISAAQSLHGLREAFMAGDRLLSNRPTGLLTGQANLFAGYLAMYGLVLLFVSRATELTRPAKLFLAGAGVLMVTTLAYTLSRGALLAFGASVALIAIAASRRILVVALLAIAIAYRWAPDEALTRTSLTLEAVQAAEDAELEKTLDASAALRLVQWKTFPELFADNPLFGSGLGTYIDRFGRATGIFRPAHATIVQIGAEMGAPGLVGYFGLLIAAGAVTFRRSRMTARGTFQHTVGLGLLAATVCLFLLDFTGARFQEHSVMTFYWLLLGAYVGNTDYLVTNQSVSYVARQQRIQPSAVN